ncbi:MAG: nucleoside monophosphate kinase [Alphaproteobacteria bacterium]|nr:nucleoside monophosphate kinase [Alphaproteobacteria bacterium]
MQNKKQIIVMMGGPGVGKGTFSRMLMAHHPYKHIEAGAILRAEPADSEIGKLISAGNLVPDELVCDLIAPLLTDKKDIILDGFPRTIGQAKWLVQNYADKFDIHILYLATDNATLITRIQKRVHDGTKRADDATMDIIRHRLENFKRITLPAVEWLRNAPGIKFSEIDAAGDVHDNFADIKSALSDSIASIP